MNQEPTFQLPGQWSTVAAQVDWVYYFLYWVSVVLFVGIVGTMLYFVWKYRRRPGVKAEPTGHNTVLELSWTFAPLILLALLFHWGFKGFIFMQVAPANAIDIRVRARKWSWDFEYPNGAHSVNELHVPINRPVRLVLSSEDVIHSFFVPAFRIKRDAVPGMYNSIWFEATRLGPTDFFCAEYCGAAATPSRAPDGSEQYTGHFSMIGRVIVEEQHEYEQFLERAFQPPTDPSTGQPVTPERWGEMLFRSNQCFTCHSTDGSPMTGPTFRGLFGKQETMTDGSTVTVDENYLRESILNPQAKIVRGYQPVMPTFRGALRDQQIDAIISYIRTLR
jgi:cytochrome c oxidase subunit 2